MASPIELKISRYLNGDLLIDTLNGSEITLKHTYNPMPGDGETDITETVNLILEGTQSTVQSTVNSINRYLVDARKRSQNGYGDRVYLEARAGTAAEWRRSEITDGRLNITDEGIQAGLSSNTRTPAMLTITRRGWWENTAGTYLPIYNSNGTATNGTDWVDVFNCADGTGSAPNKRENWVKLAAAGVGGDLPAPATMWIKEQTVGFSVQSIYVGKVTGNYGTATLNMSHYLSDRSGTADASCSGGGYQAASINTAAETLLFTASLDNSTGQLLQLAGRPYHVMARFRDNNSLSDVKFRMRVLSGAAVWTGPTFLLASTNELIQDLGIVNLPPGMSSEWSGFNLNIYGTRTTGDTETINLDFLQYFGVEFIKLYLLTASAYDLYKFGGSNGALTRYADHYITAPFMNIVGYGAPSMTVEPGREHAFIFLTSGTATAPITNNMDIRMEYRPRWSSPL